MPLALLRGCSGTAAEAAAAAARVVLWPKMELDVRWLAARGNRSDPPMRALRPLFERERATCLASEPPGRAEFTRVQPPPVANATSVRAGIASELLRGACARLNLRTPSRRCHSNSASLSCQLAHAECLQLVLQSSKLRRHTRARLTVECCAG